MLSKNRDLKKTGVYGAGFFMYKIKLTGLVMLMDQSIIKANKPDV